MLLAGLGDGCICLLAEVLLQVGTGAYRAALEEKPPVADQILHEAHEATEALHTHVLGDSANSVLSIHSNDSGSQLDCEKESEDLNFTFSIEDLQADLGFQDLSSLMTGSLDEALSSIRRRSVLALSYMTALKALLKIPNTTVSGKLRYSSSSRYSRYSRMKRYTPLTGLLVTVRQPSLAHQTRHTVWPTTSSTLLSRQALLLTFTAENLWVGICGCQALTHY